MKLRAVDLDRAALERAALLAGRRHHNNTGERQIREGKTRLQVAAIARRVLGRKNQ
jgi:hypothetical protein